MFLPPGSLTIGGYTFTPAQMAALIVLHANVQTSGRASTPRVEFGTAGYLTSGSGLKVLIVEGGASSINANEGVQLGYADTDQGQNNASAGTNQKYISGFSDTYKVMTYCNYREASKYLGCTIPTGKYPTIFGIGANVSATLYCVLA